MLEKITEYIIALAVFMAILASAVCLFQYQGQRMQQYAIEHNCKWDYNDMCSPRAQKPWLFKD